MLPHRMSSELTAETLYEGAGMALEALRQAQFIDPNPGALSPETRSEPTG